MGLQDYEKIYLLEVLVNEVSISNSSLNLDQDTLSNLKETCVTFQFLNNPPLVVCEEDFYKSPPNPNLLQLNFKSGKSCLFSICSSDIPNLPYKFDINVSIIRTVDSKKKIVLGSSVINLGDSFTQLMHSSVNEQDLPVQKTKTGTFYVYDENKREIGFINAFLRLSCFGQLIVTQFQVGDKKKNNFMFRGTEQKKIVEIQGDISNIPNIQVDPKYVPPKPIENVQTLQPNFKTSTAYGYGDISEGMLIPFQQRNLEVALPQYEQPLPPQESPGDYKEIVAEIRGHLLHIKVPSRPKKDVLCKKQLVEEMEGPVCKYAPQLDFCDCDFPVPPETIPRCGPL